MQNHLSRKITLNSLTKSVLFILFIIICSYYTNFAQSSANLSGLVVDSNGAVIPNVTVVILNAETALERTVTTNADGYYSFPLLPPARYSLTAKREGFSPVEIKNIELNVNDQRSLRIELKTGSVGAEVQVTTEPSLIEESPAVGTLVDRQFVKNLPLNGRSFQSLFELTPGVVLVPAGSNEQGQFSVNGQRPNANYFTVDGVAATASVTAGGTLGQSAGGSVPAFSAQGGTNSLVSVDALEEFKIQTSSYAPEFGRSPGGQISIITRSGNNKFTGTVFEYFRNEALDANDWFANSRRLRRPPLRQNNFGGVLGGPIILPRFGEGTPFFWNGKNKTFFFFSYEGLRLKQPQTRLIQVPSLASRQNAAPSVRPYLNAFPIPTGPDAANGFAEFATTYADPQVLDAVSLRIDHKFTDNITFFSRYNHAPSSVKSRSTFSTLSEVSSSQINTDSLTFGLTQIFSAKLSNEIRANYSFSKGFTRTTGDDFGGAVPLADNFLYPPGLSSDFAAITFSAGSARLAPGALTNSRQRQFNIVDNVSLTAGGHQLKFGFDFRRLLPTSAIQPYSLSVTFANIAQTVTGIAPTGQAIGTVPADVQIDNFSLYGQDTWRIKQRLTLTYGVRWELNPPPKGRNGTELVTVQGLESRATIDAAPLGTPLFKTTYNNFAPRFGAAYQLSQKQGRETVLRGGVGIFYDLGTGSFGDSLTFFPYNRVTALTNITFPLNFALLQPAPFTFVPNRARTFVFDPNLKMPRTYQWNLSVEQSLGSNQSFTVSYVGALGRKLLSQERNFNPNIRYLFVNVTKNTAYSDYHALQAQFQRRLSKGLQVLASYAWGKSLDTFSADSLITGRNEQLDYDAERGPSSFDVRHSLTTAVTYDIKPPKFNAFANAILQNWSLDGIFRTRTATPVNIVNQNFLVAADGEVVQGVFRPDLILGVPLYLDNPSVAGGRVINSAAFIRLPQTTLRQGNLGRNALRGFGVWQLDMAVRREFNLTEKLKLQFRGEAFNVTNHPNFANPVNTLSSGTQFGQSFAMLGRALGSGGGAGQTPLYNIGGPRSVQLAVKLLF